MKQTENSFSLGGIWKYIADPEEKLSFDDIRSVVGETNLNEMEIPSNWHLRGLNNFNGSVWFIKKFPYDPGKNHLKILKFGGVDYISDVWLNSIYLGHHEGYFQSFYFDITESVRWENLLIVRVSSPLEEPGKVWPLKKKLIKGIFNHHDCRPGGWDLQKGQDKNTGGIWNTVDIISGFPVYISNIKISLKINNTTNRAVLVLEFEYFLKDTLVIQSLINIAVISPSGEKIIKSLLSNFSTGKTKFHCILEIDNPELWCCWDIGQPFLYNIIITSEAFEEQNIVYGIREIKLDEKQQFFINGKRLFLRGTNIIPEQFLSNLTKEKITLLVKLIKDANINIVRVHAHVNRQELYDEFDKQGILIWQDFALQWTYDDSPEFISNAVSQIKDMVRQLYNYSSICFWCCHNEPGEQIHSLDHLLKQAILTEDSSRIIRIASNYEEHPYDGWYWGDKEHFAAAPMGPLVTEFGAQALPSVKSLKKIFKQDDLFPPAWDRWKYHNFQADQTFNIAKVETGSSLESFIFNSQKYQSELLKTAVEFYRRKRFNGITGIFQFMFIDCWPSITWSVIDYYENPKPGYTTLGDLYQPVFISINVRQNQYYPGKKILIDLYIINDLQKDFPDCSLVFFLDGKECCSMDKINITRDSICFIKYESINILLSDDICIGQHNLKISLIQHSSIVTTNSFGFNVVDKLI